MNPAASDTSSSSSIDSTSWFARTLNQSSSASSSTSSSSVRGDSALRLSSSSSSRGRHLISGNRVDAGTTILSEVAHFAVLSPQQIEERCSACWKSLASNDDTTQQSQIKKLRCSACAVCRYCSPSCQKAHWSRSHQYECICLRAYRNLLDAGDSKAEHPAYVPTSWLISQILLHQLQGPLRQLRNEAIDMTVRDSPTWKAKEQKRIEVETERQRSLDGWLARWNQLNGNMKLHSNEKLQNYAKFGSRVREITLHACLNNKERDLHSRLFPTIGILMHSLDFT